VLHNQINLAGSQSYLNTNTNHRQEHDRKKLKIQPVAHCQDSL